MLKMAAWSSFRHCLRLVTEAVGRERYSNQMRRNLQVEDDEDGGVGGLGRVAGGEGRPSAVLLLRTQALGNL
jgi:hypothetical protein